MAGGRGSPRAMLSSLLGMLRAGWRLRLVRMRPTGIEVWQLLRAGERSENFSQQACWLAYRRGLIEGDPDAQDGPEITSWRLASRLASSSSSPLPPSSSPPSRPGASTPPRARSSSPNSAGGPECTAVPAAISSAPAAGIPTGGSCGSGSRKAARTASASATTVSRSGSPARTAKPKASTSKKTRTRPRRATTPDSENP